MATPAAQHTSDGHGYLDRSNATQKHQCPTCPSSFKRLEHLKRHQRNHENRKRFSCEYCAKKFARSDILGRHTATHTHVTRLAEHTSVETTGSKRKRACAECARVREKCTKGQPCLRCSTRALRCVYPDSRHPDLPQMVPEGAESDTGPSEVDDMMEDHQEPTPSLTRIAMSPSVYGDGFTGAQNLPPEKTGAVGDAHLTRGQLSNLNSLQTTLVAESDQSIRSYSGDAGIVALLHADAYQSVSSSACLTSSLNSGIDIASNSPNVLSYSGAMYDASSDFPINWLPANETEDIDYTSILGLGINSSGLFDTSTYPNQLEYTAQGSVPQPPLAASPAQTISTTSPHSFEPVPPTKMPGGLYATSMDGGRAPCTVRSKPPSVMIYNASALRTIENSGDMRDKSTEYGFPDVSHITSESELGPNPRAMPPETYSALLRNFDQICLRCDGFYPPFSTNHFPPVEHFNLFVRLFFKQFNPIFPILHETLSMLEDHWPLALAAAAIGCQYTRTQEFSECVLPMHEFLRRVVGSELDRASLQEPHLSNLQTAVLSQIAMLYYGHPNHVELAKVRHAALVRHVHAYGLMQQPSAQVVSAHGQEGLDHEGLWRRWVEEETRRRLGYAIWLVESMSVYHLGCRPLLALECAHGQLPQEGPWQASNSHEWWLSFKKSEGTPSLATAVHTLFVEKRVGPEVGEFGRIILLHGVYQELFRVKEYLKRSLAAWIPSAEKPDLTSDLAENLLKSVSGQVHPTLTNWRNASLDCVDVLHWAANATIARLSGSEHPTVLHLHMSRIVLLAPYEAIQTLALSIASLAQPRIEGLQYPTKEQALEAELEILQWAQRDEHKARLCMIHCGCLFWHVRRYSTMAFYEPTSVYLAALAIWAYGSYTSRSPRTQGHPRSYGRGQEIEELANRCGNSSRHQTPDIADASRSRANHNVESANSQRSEGSSQPVLINSPLWSTLPESDLSFIRLDRPCDDELVCFYVRHGRPSAMQAYISGVGDICSREGPGRMLREGRKLLNGISLAWGRSKEHVSLLATLERVTARTPVVA